MDSLMLRQVYANGVDPLQALRAHCPDRQLIVRDQQNARLWLCHPCVATCSEILSVGAVYLACAKSCVAPALTVRDGIGGQISFGLGDTVEVQ